MRRLIKVTTAFPAPAAAAAIIATIRGLFHPENRASRSFNSSSRLRISKVASRNFNREALRIEVDTSLPAARFVRALDQLIEIRGRPQVLRSDNGPEFLSEALARWAHHHGVELRFIQPGKPMQNGYVERFNRTYREEVLNCYVFETLGDVRRMTAEWLIRYNEQRPHESLGNLSPRQYLMAKSP
jgi:putative transposase